MQCKNDRVAIAAEAKQQSQASAQRPLRLQRGNRNSQYNPNIFIFARQLDVRGLLGKGICLFPQCKFWL